MKHSSTVPGRLGLDSFRKNRMCGIYYDTHNRIPRNLKFCEKMMIRLFDLLTFNEFKVKCSNGLISPLFFHIAVFYDYFSYEDLKAEYYLVRFMCAIY